MAHYVKNGWNLLSNFFSLICLFSPFYFFLFKKIVRKSFSEKSNQVQYRDIHHNHLLAMVVNQRATIKYKPSWSRIRTFLQLRLKVAKSWKVISVWPHHLHKNEQKHYQQTFQPVQNQKDIGPIFQNWRVHTYICSRGGREMREVFTLLLIVVK